MGAGLSAQAKVKELQDLPQKEAMAYMQDAGVPKAEAKVVMKRVREMETVDAIAVAMLVDGLSGETQDALAAMAQGSGLPGSIAHTESLEDEVERLLSEGWSEPPGSLDDGPSLVGYTVWVARYGKGRVTNFVRARMGASSHVIEFQNPVEGAARISRTVKLRRKGNSETRWLVQLPTTVVVGDDSAERSAAARDARLSLLGGRQTRAAGSVEPEPEPEQMGSARPRTPPWAQWWKANGPGTEQRRRNLTQQQQQRQQQQQQQRLDQRRQQHSRQEAPHQPSGLRYSNGLTAGGKQHNAGQRRRPPPAATSSLPPWDLEPVSTGTTTAAAFAEACAANGDSGEPSIAGEEEIGESLNDGGSYSSQTAGQHSSFSASLKQFLEEEAAPSMPPQSHQQGASRGDNGSLPTVSSVSSESDAVEFGTFGSTPSEWTVKNTPREGGDEANVSIEENLDESNLSIDEPGQALGLGLSGSRSDLRMGAPGDSAKMMAARAQGHGARSLGQHTLPKPQQGGNGATVKAGRWKKGQLLGTGSFGQVYQGLNLDTGAMLAVKVLTVPGGQHDTNRTGQGILNEIHKEIELMSSLCHANIVQYLGAEVDVRERELFIFQEWVPGGSLSAVLEQFGGQFEPSLIRRYLVHLLGGLEYLHEHMIVHRDIKGENVLVSEDGTAKLADFGASKRLGPDGTLCESHHSLKGTPYFMAPEQMLQENVGRKSDIWALGGVALLMATGQPPWAVCKVANPYALFLKVYESKSPPPMDEAALDPMLYSLLTECFTREPDKRPSAAQLKTHSFVLHGP